MIRVAAISCLLIAFAPSASATGEAAPIAPEPARLEGASLVAAASSRADERWGTWRVRRSRARVEARERAVARLHRFVDDHLARTAALPTHVAAAHRVVSETHRVVASAPRLDGGAIVRVAVARDALRRAAPVRGVDW